MSNQKPNIRMLRGFLTIDNWSINLDAASTIVWRDWDVLDDDEEDIPKTENNAALTMYFPFMLDDDGMPKDCHISYNHHDDGKTIAYTQILFMAKLAIQIRKALDV